METEMRSAAIYARVSKQKEENIASQTAALLEFAHKQGYDVPAEWVFEDEDFSAATLVRPGLERLRDLAAEGQITAVLVYAPDRLSRKYAYQILLIEEFARNGVETIFVKAPTNATAEDQLLLQVQGMIAEYERAQILERSRRGKRHRARQGQVSVLSAPYGYRYMRKTEETAAYYQIIEAEADVAPDISEIYDRASQHRRHRTFTQRAGDADAQTHRPMGTLDSVGCAAQPCLQGNRLFWQNGDRTTAARHPTAAHARRRFSAQ
jgi:site-specific DNA recombinase